MDIASDLLPNFLFCSAGFLPLPDVHSFLEHTDEDPSSYAGSSSALTILIRKRQNGETGVFISHSLENAMLPFRTFLPRYLRFA